MCVYNITKPKLSNESIFAFKVVKRTTHPGHFVSACAPNRRLQQADYATIGHSERYRLGSYNTAFTSTPGFYCYRSKHDAISGCGVGRVVVLVRIPPRTPYRFANRSTCKKDVILAETIQPLEVIYAPSR